MEEAGPSKKRKRTGKARVEAKRAAIAAKEILKANDATVKDAAAPMEDEGNAPGLGLDAVAGRIPRALKALHPIFKQGRTFEIRRTLKKVKFLRAKDGNQDEIKAMESQLTILSHLPLDHTMTSHLLTKLQKHSRFKHSTLPAAITAQLKSESTASTSAQSELISKVENRLCSNKSVSEGVKAVVSWIMGENGAKLPSTGRKGPPTTSLDSKQERRETKVKPTKALSLSKDVDEDDNVSVDGAVDEAGWESGSISGSDDPIPGHPQSDSESEASEPDTDSDVAVPVPKMSRRRSPQPAIKSSKPANLSKATKAPVISSTFLPSLSAGFTLGDSDSDPDLDPDVDGSGVVGNKVVRKNRRGQRARQAIWEQKFGKHAKHVVARQRAEEDAKRAVQARAGRGRGRGGMTGGPGRWGAQGGKGGGTYGHKSGGATRGEDTSGRPVQAHTDPRPAAPQAPPAGVHPSWQAAKIRKQKETSAVKPQGTKIVFD